MTPAPSHSPDPSACFLRLPAVISRTGLSRSSIYAAIKEGAFPAPVKLLAGERSRAIGWPAGVIDQWVASRITGDK